ncbi:MAG: DUF1552 domain-containing protein [Acidobacteria bacterium]|nr:DUF1552 domain-containing protein [Acidobacteriota bacterium]
MILTKKALPRRTILRGLGTTIALPLLDSMVPVLSAFGQSSASPVRLGFVYVPNGIIGTGPAGPRPNQWTPTAEGSGFEFTPLLKSLEPFRDRLVVLSGLAQVNGRALGDGPGDHARAGATWLTGVHPKKTEGADIRAGVSADQIAARALGQHTELASLELGLEQPFLAGGCDSGYSCAYTNTLSWRGPTTPLPVEVNPRAVFERLFGETDSTDPAARLAMLDHRRSILDYVSANLDRLSRRVGTGDRRKLTEYLDAVRDIERRIQRAEQRNAAIAVPTMERPTAIPEDFEDQARLMMDLLVLAWQTDMTRVTTLMMAREGSNRSYRSIGVSDGHHSLTHHQNDPEKIDKVLKIDQLHVETFAYLVDRLRTTPDGDGSLLDHSVLLYGSSICDGNRHTHHDLPAVVVGGANGQLKGGRHIAYPRDTPLNNLLLNLLGKAGVEVDQFGDSTGVLSDI